MAMKYYDVDKTDMRVSCIGLGCMNFGGHWSGSDDVDKLDARAEEALLAALDAGINFFDHADLYAGGLSEEKFSALWKLRPGIRDKVYVQSKCDIRWEDPVFLDASSEHITSSVEKILSRLKTDYLDVLLLHWPDLLSDPQEIADAFTKLHSSGKVRYFGVSNYTAPQMAMLSTYMEQPLVFNQVNINLMSTAFIDDGLQYGQSITTLPLAGHGTLEYCMQHRIIPQAWGPLMSGGPLSDNPSAANKRLATAITTLAEKHNAPREAIALAWLLRHPARIQPMMGSRTPSRIAAACRAVEVTLDRAEWYTLYREARGLEIFDTPAQDG